MTTGLKFTGGGVSKLYSPMLNNMANVSRIGLISGCAVTAGTGMAVNIANGKIFFGSTTKDVSPVTNLAISTNANANPRQDLIVIDSTGTVSVLAGTANVNAIPADYDNDTYVVIAMVVVYQSTVSISSTNITDIRVLNQGGSSGSSGGGTLGTFTQDFTSQTTVVVTHNLADINARVEVVNASKVTIVPSSITRTDANTVTVTFGSSTSGTVLVTGGIGVNNGYYSTTFTSQTSLTLTHNLKSKYVSVICYNASNQVIIPNSITMTSDNVATVTFSVASTGTAVVIGGVSSNRRKDEALISNYENQKLNVTNASSAVTFTGYADMYNLTLSNAGTKTAYIVFGGTATTSGFALLPKTKVFLNNVKNQTVSSICGGTDTTTVYLQADYFVGGSSRTTATQYSVSCTSTSATQSLGTGTKKILIQNFGDYNVFYNFTTTATTNDMVLFPYDYKEIEVSSLQNISAICNSGETAVLKILMFS